MTVFLDTSITVLSIDHKSGTQGKYFNFDRQTTSLNVNERRTFLAYVPRIKTTARVKVWGQMNGGGSLGTAHGRFVEEATEGQWRVGDRIIPMDQSIGKFAVPKIITFKADLHLRAVVIYIFGGNVVEDIYLIDIYYD